MSSPGNRMGSPERALSAYFNALLAEPDAPVVAGNDDPADDSYLFFRVSPLLFALPAPAVAVVTPPPVDMTPCGAPGCLGCTPRDGHGARVVDAAALLLPDARRVTVDTAEQRVLWLAGSAVGLLCDAVLETAAVDAAAVSWRGADSRRPWLAGTWRERRCALIDPRGLVRTLPGCDCQIEKGEDLP